MKRTLLVLSLLLLVLGVSCREGARRESDYVLYFLTDAGVSHGPALTPEAYPGHRGDETPPGPAELLEALLKGPRTEKLRSPFPPGVTLRWWEWDEEQPGNLRIGLSEQYGELTDAALTLADYCIVLTLSQAEGVESVEIVSEGHADHYRSHQLLLPEEAVLWDKTAEREQRGA